MTSWLTWPVEWLAQHLKSGRLDEIQRTLSAEPYVDVEQLARLNGISEAEAEAELERAVQAGRLEKMYLYIGTDSPVQFVVPETLLGKSIPLSEIDIFTEEPDHLLELSSLRTKLVYVATGELTHPAHAASTT